MCDPVTAGWVVGGMVAGMAVASSQKPATPRAPEHPDPAIERAKAEAAAAQSANAQLAADNRRRREGGSLIARGAPQPTFGDKSTGQGADDGSLNPISGTRTVSRGTLGRATASLISRGAPPNVYGGGGGLGGGGMPGRSNQLVNLQ